MARSHLRRFLRWLYRNRSINLTPEGTRFVLLALAIGLAAINTGNNLLYLLLAMMLSLIVLSGILSEQCLRRLYIQRRLPDHLFAGEPATAYFTVSNRKAHFPSFSLRLLDVIGDEAADRGVHVMHLAPGTSTLRSYSLLVPRRGPFHIDGIKVLTRFPFSLFVKGLTLPLRSDALAYPCIKPLPRELYGELNGLGQDVPLHRRGIGVDLYNLRLYQPGDDSRAIHWRTTAKTSMLIIRETEAEDQRHVTLALPTAPPPPQGTAPAPSDDAEHFERAVELTASLTVHFQDHGFAVGAVIGDQHVPQGTGEDHVFRILKALALCQPVPPARSAGALEDFSRLMAQAAEEDLVVLVLPWPREDPRLAPLAAGATRVVRASEGEPDAR